MDTTSNTPPQFAQPTPVEKQQPQLKEPGSYVPDPKPKRPSSRKESAKEVTASHAGKGLGDSYVITLHDSKEIPPGGQLVAVNGSQFRIPAGRKCIVPAAVLEVLDNAVQSVPELDGDLRVINYHSAPRLSYTLHREPV